MANIQAFTTALQGGGARANQFQVTMAGGGATGIQSRGFSFLWRGAQIPAMTIGEVAVPYRGRQIFLAGDRTYDAWTVTIMNDRSYGIRSQLESWMNNLQDIGNSTSSAVTDSQSYYATATVKQKDRNDDTIRTYILEGCWPQTLDAIDLAYDTNDAVQEFGATFRFNFMTASNNVTSGPGGSINISASIGNFSGSATITTP